MLTWIVSCGVIIVTGMSFVLDAGLPDFMLIHGVAFADYVFGTNSSNNDVFDNVVRPIVNATVNGFNGTVFAYGQTSSGKTYTMMGTSEEPGIIPMAVEHMFDAIANTPGREFLLRLISIIIKEQFLKFLIYFEKLLSV